MNATATAYWESPLGFFEITSSDHGLRAMRLLKNLPSGKKKGFGNGFSDEVITELTEYFEGNRKTFQIPLDISGHATFYRLVWKELLNIPYGHTKTYADIAHAIGNPNGSRAVGMANRMNPIPIIIPCHRVIGSDGSMTGYMYGTDVKTYLLELENPAAYGHQTRLF